MNVIVIPLPFWVDVYRGLGEVETYVILPVVSDINQLKDHVYISHGDKLKQRNSDLHHSFAASYLVVAGSSKLDYVLSGLY